MAEGFCTSPSVSAGVPGTIHAGCHCMALLSLCMNLADAIHLRTQPMFHQPKHCTFQFSRRLIRRQYPSFSLDWPPLSGLLCRIFMEGDRSLSSLQHWVLLRLLRRGQHPDFLASWLHERLWALELLLGWELELRPWRTCISCMNVEGASCFWGLF